MWLKASASINLAHVNMGTRHTHGVQKNANNALSISGGGGGVGSLGEGGY